MKKVWFTALILVGLTAVPALAVGWGSDGKAAASQPIILGADVALSGLAEPFDTPPTIGAELAIQDINKSGGVLGRPLKLIKADYKSDPAIGGDVALRLLGQGAKILIASCDFDFGSPGARAANDKGVLAFSLCASSPLFGPAGISGLSFTAGTASNVQAAAAAEWAYKNKGWRNTYLLQDKTISFTSGWVNDFQQRWRELTGKAGIHGLDSFKNSDPSFASEVTNIKRVASKLDFITICTFPPGGATLVREIRAAGIKLPIVACLAMGGTYWLKAVPGLTNFYTAEHATSYPQAPDSDPRVNKLLKRYIAKAGSAPAGSTYTIGYAMIQMVAKAITRAKTTDGLALQKVLEKFKNEPTLAGPTTFTAKIHIRANAIPYAIMGIRNGKPIFVTRITPSNVPPIKF